MNSTKQTLMSEYLRVVAGPQSNLRTPPGTEPIFVKRGSGARVWDAHGTEHIDFTASAGPAILGHGNPEQLSEIKRQLDTLCHTHPGEMCSELQTELAQAICTFVPCAQSVRFLLSGTEAVQLAIRLARAHTGRTTFVRFEGHYHGWLDNISGGSICPSARGYSHPDDSPEDSLYTAGRAPDAFAHSLMLPWNDPEILASAFRDHGNDIALVLMEPIMCNGGCCWPKPGYLERVRQLCDENGALLCFDEILTGFRMGMGGAQEALGVTPDLAVFGKALAGGLPLSAVAGSRSIMQLLENRQVVAGGTFNGYPLGVASALATLRILSRDNGAFFRNLEHLTLLLSKGLQEIADRRGIAMLIQSINGLIKVMFTDRRIASDVQEVAEEDSATYHRFAELMRASGVLLLWNGRWYLHGGFTEQDIAAALDRADDALGKLQSK